MKTLSMIVVATLFSTAAYADCTARKNTEFPCDPDLVRSGYYAREEYYAQLKTPMQGPFTSEQINRALERTGRPEHEQISHSRSLEEARPQKRELSITETITNR